MIHELESGPRADCRLRAPARYANVRPGGSSLCLPCRLLPSSRCCGRRCRRVPSSLPALVFPTEGAPRSGRLSSSTYGAYQACLGSDDDWNDERDDSSTVADNPGALGCGAYQDLNCGRWRYRLSTCSDLSLGSRSVLAPQLQR